MIDQLTIRGFKRFDAARLSIEPLTVLTGLNGAGKTSVIQSLLLMREANRSQHVKLRGPFDLELGTAADVVNWQHSTDVEFHVREDGVAFDWVLQSPSDEARHLLVIARPDPLPMAFQATPGRFTYLSAERLGPRVRVDASSPLMSSRSACEANSLLRSSRHEACDLGSTTGVTRVWTVRRY